MDKIELIKGLREQIVENLRDEILSGRIPEGTPLHETALSKKFGVSRGPIREALLFLTSEGLLITERNSVARVAPAAPDSIHGVVIPIRRTIEIAALRSFFHDITEKDFERWEIILVRLKSACERKDYSAIAEQDMALHRSILERAQQPDLIAIWSVIVARIRHHFRKNHQAYENAMEIYAEHRELIDTFRTGDLEKSVKLLEENIGDPVIIKES